VAAQRSVVKHSYLTGRNEGVARAQAHVKYIQNRSGKDKDQGARKFFDSGRDVVGRRQVAIAVRDQNPRGTVMHKLVLSPGVQGADSKEYTREVMADLGSRKGLELEWYAVEHDNTANPHVHVVVMGKDQNGHKVRLSKDDYTKMKEAGDRYLERNRLLEREDKEKERERSRTERQAVGRFVDALKAAAQEFSRSWNKGKDAGEKKPETKFEKRRREKDEERQHEVSALGETIDMDAYLAKQAAKEEREEARKQAAWKEYCKPIEIDRGGHEPIKYDRSCSMASLRGLEKDYRDEDPRTRECMTEADGKRLNDWIKEKYREEKRVEAKAEKLESIDLTLDSDTEGKWTPASSLEDLRQLEALNTRGEVYLEEPERKALGKWIKDQDLREPVRIEIESGSEPLVYDRDDSKESLQFLATEYQNGAAWAKQNLSRDDYWKVRAWIEEKDKPREPEKADDKSRDDRLKVGDKYLSKDMDADVLRSGKAELAREPEKNKGEIEKLSGWIEDRDKVENKEPEKSPRFSRQKTARQSGVDRAVRQDRMARYDSYYKEKAEQRNHLEGQRENLKAQKRALNKYEHERETVDGQYSEIWGADKSGIAAGPMGAASGGARPLGANQFVRLLQQASKSHEAQRKASEVREKTTQVELERKLEADSKKAPKAERAEDKPPRSGKKEKSGPAPKSLEPAKEPELAPVDNKGLETDTRELGKEIENKKKKEQDRDKRPGTDKEKENPFIRDPWGRW